MPGAGCGVSDAGWRSGRPGTERRHGGLLGVLQPDAHLRSRALGRDQRDRGRTDEDVDLRDQRTMARVAARVRTAMVTKTFADGTDEARTRQRGMSMIEL